MFVLRIIFEFFSYSIHPLLEPHFTNITSITFLPLGSSTKSHVSSFRHSSSLIAITHLFDFTQVITLQYEQGWGKIHIAISNEVLLIILATTFFVQYHKEYSSSKRLHEVVKFLKVEFQSIVCPLMFILTNIVKHNNRKTKSCPVRQYLDLTYILFGLGPFKQFITLSL